MKHNRYFIIIILCLVLWCCKDEPSYLPKPRIYPHVSYPESSFVGFENEECPFSMQIPGYMNYVKDSLRNENESGYNCWFDLYAKGLNTVLHMSYVSFEGRRSFDKLVEDAFEMADKHNIKASYRDEIKISFPDRSVYGILFEIDGPVASPLQFYLTDSTHHFLRGSLYFRDVVNRDSIEPVYKFVTQDLQPMFQSFEWQ